jgi:glycosyltransferase involved in cell wall biosynthesis/Sec-independent protein translocase protein TatA
MVVAAAGGGSRGGSHSLMTTLRIAVTVLVGMLMIAFAYQQGNASSQQEIALLRRQLAHVSSLANRDTTAKLRNTTRAIGKVMKPKKTDAASNVAETVAQAKTRKPRKSKRATPPPETDASAEIETPQQQQDYSDAEKQQQQPSGTGGGNEKAEPADNDDRPIPTEAPDEVLDTLVEWSADTPAYILHRSPKEPKIIVSALGRKYPNFKMSAPATVVDDEQQAYKAHDWSKKMWEAIGKAWASPEDPEVVPVMVVPLFHDAEEVKALLRSIDAPVRLFAFSWNSVSRDIAHVVDVVKKFPYGVIINHFPDNMGFSGAVNAGIKSGQLFLPSPQPKWFFIVNADTEFPRGVLPRFAGAVNSLDDTFGLAYGPRQDHFAFVITQMAVEKVGYMDEVFFPGYMEDIDYHWRVRIAGLQKRITNAPFHHKQSANDRKSRSVTGDYQDMLMRSSRGWEYGWMKWGRYGTEHIEHDHPPSGWKTPFHIPDAPLSLWALDPGVRQCVRTGKGQYHISSSTCWYNGSRLLAYAPKGTILSNNLVRPGPTGR